MPSKVTIIKKYTKSFPFLGKKQFAGFEVQIELVGAEDPIAARILSFYLENDINKKNIDLKPTDKRDGFKHTAQINKYKASLSLKEIEAEQMKLAESARIILQTNNVNCPDIPKSMESRVQEAPPVTYSPLPNPDTYFSDYLQDKLENPSVEAFTTASSMSEELKDRQKSLKVIRAQIETVMLRPGEFGRSINDDLDPLPRTIGVALLIDKICRTFADLPDAVQVRQQPYSLSALSARGLDFDATVRDLNAILLFAIRNLDSVLQECKLLSDAGMQRASVLVVDTKKEADLRQALGYSVDIIGKLKAFQVISADIDRNFERAESTIEEAKLVRNLMHAPDNARRNSQ